MQYNEIRCNSQYNSTQYISPLQKYSIGGENVVSLGCGVGVDYGIGISVSPKLVLVLVLSLPVNIKSVSTVFQLNITL